MIDLWFPSKVFINQTKKPIPIYNYELITLEQSYYGCTIPIIIKKWIIRNNQRKNVEETVYIDIPQGVNDNESIIIRNVGNCFDTSLGDVNVFIMIQNLTKFRRHELDLYYKRKITLKESLCGFSFDLLHLNGETYHITNLKKITLITPTFTVKLSKLGMIHENTVGNLIIEFEIEYPTLTSIYKSK
jgi:DnaJ-class molecular chaperone